MDDEQIVTLQALVEYYRNKCNKLEYDFVQYQIKADSIIKSLEARNGQHNENSKTESRTGN